MLIKNPHNLLSYTKSVKFLTYLDNCVEKFQDKIGLIKNAFSENLPYSEKQFPKYINPNDDSKNLKIQDLIFILDGLDKEYQFKLISWLATNYNFTLIDNQIEKNNHDPLETLLLKLTSTNGQLSSEFLKAYEDDDINQDEEKELKAIAIKFRSLLRTFENRIGQNND